MAVMHYAEPPREVSRIRVEIDGDYHERRFAKPVTEEVALSAVHAMADAMLAPLPHPKENEHG